MVYDIMIYDMKIAIIGGGASGMFLASKLKSENVVLFEKNVRLGKKLLITGNGKCNFTNENFEDLNKIYNNDFAINIYKKYDNKSFIDFFKSIGIVPKIETHKNINYYYPNTNTSISVYYNLIDKINYNGIKVKCGVEIVNIKKQNDKFVLLTNKNEKYIFDKVVIATGGMSYQNTGSNGSGYGFAIKFNHKIVKPIPGLCGLKYDNNDLKKLKGIRINAFVSAYIENEFFASEKGEIQWTEYGISGIPIMNLSRKINRFIENKKKVVLSINFVEFDDNINADNIDDDIIKEINSCEKKHDGNLLDLKSKKFLQENNNYKKYLFNIPLNLVYNKLLERKNNISYKKSIDFLCGYLPDELGKKILKLSNINLDKFVYNITDNEIKKIAQNLIDFKVEIKSFCGFDNAQVTLGGIDVVDIDNNTLESKLVEGLYFIGEVMDIDGKCGGYNLQMAYSTASMVAEHLNKGIYRE